MTPHRNLVGELKRLRKGRGVLATRIDLRVGPALRTACGIARDDGPAATRQKLIARLNDLVRRLPDDLRLAVLAAFALHPAARLPLYQERVQWASTQLERDPRTIRRRVDEAVEQLAELAAATPGGGDWRTEELRVAVVLDAERFEVIEQHQVVAERELSELGLVAPVPARRPDLDAGLLYGGTLLDHGAVAHDRPRFTLALAEPLAPGQSLRFAVRYRLPRRSGRPAVLHVPERPCDLLDLHVRFEPDQRPSHVRMLNGAQRRTDIESLGARQPVNSAGEVHLTFRGLVPGLVYGAQWEPQLLCRALRGSYQVSPAGSPAMFHAQETVGVMRL